MVLFNKGFMCTKCGPTQDVAVKTKGGLKRKVCKTCESVVTPWEKPLNERAGRCSCCAHGSFKQAIRGGQFLTCCKNCEQVVNVDTNTIIRKGWSK